MNSCPYICINCVSPLPALYEQYAGGHIRLSLCQYCHTVADKYIEYDNVLLFLDLILIKPSAYRHTIYNLLLAPASPGKDMVMATATKLNNINNNINSKTKKQKNPVSTDSLSEGASASSLSIPPVIRLGILMVLFEVYVTWAYQEKSFMENGNHTSLIISLVLKGPIQYIYFLSTTLLQNLLLCICLSYYSLQWLSCSAINLQDVTSDLITPLPSRPSSPHTMVANQQLPRANILRLPSYQQRDKSPSPFSSSSSSPIQNSVLQIPLPTKPLSLPAAEHSFSSSSQLRSKLMGIEIGNNSESLFQKFEVYNEYKRPKFRRIFQIMITTVLISNTIKLFPIVMLIWPYDAPVLHTTRFFVRMVHLFLLIEAVYIVLIDPKQAKKKSIKNSPSNSNEYYKVAAVVLTSELIRAALSHIIVVFIASAIWGVSVREIGLDDWKMFNVGIKMIEELGVYMLGEV